MLKIQVGNIKLGDQGVYIGRPNKDRPGSPLANPEYLAKEEDRAKNIAGYKVWLWAKIQARDPKVMAELWRLLGLARRPEGVTLLCWCVPKQCHGDVIKAALQWLDEQAQVEDAVTRVGIEELGGVPVDYSTGEILQW
jgi:hypothetical protein